MANLDSDAILTRIRAVLETAAGSLRTIGSTAYDGGLYDGQDPNESSRRAAFRPVTEASITTVERHEASPPWKSSLALYKLGIEVRVVRHVDHTHKSSNALRDDAKALAANDADVLAQALCYLGNITSATTGVVSGQLQYMGSDVEVSLDDDEAPRIQGTHRFEAVASVTLATS